MKQFEFILQASNGILNGEVLSILGYHFAGMLDLPERSMKGSAPRSVAITPSFHQIFLFLVRRGIVKEGENHLTALKDTLIPDACTSVAYS